MRNEEGTPKRRRGLFRRDRTNDTSPEPRLAADGFDDPWSASAWDDWDDDFTAGNLRSSVPAAAAPRPEAVDAWLQSEADDFDTATRLNAKRWGGEANRQPAAGLASLRQNLDSNNDAPPAHHVPAVPELSLRDRGLDQPTGSTGDAWANDPNVVVPGNTPVLSAPVDEGRVHEEPLDEDLEVDAAVHEEPVEYAPVHEELVDDAAVVDAPVHEELVDDAAVHEELVDDAAVHEEPVDDAAVHEELVEYAPVHEPPPTEVPTEEAAVEEDAAPPVPVVAESWPESSAESADDPAEDPAEDPADELQRSVEMAEMSPTWEPVADRSAHVSDYTSDGDLDDVLDALAADSTGIAEVLTEVVTDDTAHVSRTEAEPDELREIDEIEPSDEFTPELALLDAAPAEPPAPVASWAPVETIEVRVPIAAESSTVDDRRQPVAPSAPAPPTPSPSRFVSVSVVNDDPALPGPVAPVAPVAPVTPVVRIVDLPSPPPSAESAALEPPTQARTSDGDVQTGAVEIAPVAAVPAGRSRRWADLAAEFGSDGDLEDSYPRRSRPAPPPPASAAVLTDHTPPPKVEEPEDDDPATPMPAAENAVEPPTEQATPMPAVELAVEPPTEQATPMPAVENAVEPPTEPVVDDEPSDHEPATQPAAAKATHLADVETPVALDDELAADFVEDAGSDEVDPWSLPPVRGPRRPADVEPPVRSRLPDTSDAAPSRPVERPTRRPEPRPSASRPDDAPSVRPVRPAAERTPRPATGQRASISPVSPEFSTFAGVIGSALVAFAVARLVLALVGNQPKIPATFTGTSARLVRLGATFTTTGTSWPLALLVGTVLLLLPVFVGFADHLQRWAPMLGLASVTAIASLIIGGLEFYAGHKLGTPSTLRLVSDVIVGPVGFGVLTLVAIAFGTRAHRR